MVYLRGFTPTKAPTLKAKWLKNSVNLPVCFVRTSIDMVSVLLTHALYSCMNGSLDLSKLSSSVFWCDSKSLGNMDKKNQFHIEKKIIPFYFRIYILISFHCISSTQQCINFVYIIFLFRTFNVHSWHDKKGLSDIKVNNLITNFICNRMQ
jgi:hypothetical protein